jgi:uncharacterized protein (TIGR00369 family)
MTTDSTGPPAGPRRLDVAMGIVISEATADRAVATMPVAGNTQPFGLLHGGATCVLAETLGSIAATLYAGDGRVAVGVDINATHHRAMRDGVVTGVATPLHRGRTVACYEIAVTDEDGRRVATARLTCQILDAPGATHEALAWPTRE